MAQVFCEDIYYLQLLTCFAFVPAQIVQSLQRFSMVPFPYGIVFSSPSRSFTFTLFGGTLAYLQGSCDGLQQLLVAWGLEGATLSFQQELQDMELPLLPPAPLAF